MKHKSVLLNEAVEALNIKPDGIYVDATMGGGGHSEEICKRLSRDGHFIGFDQDSFVQERVKQRLAPYECQKDFIQDNFKNLKEELDLIGVNHIDGILFDLGVSSFQFDDAERGFSYHQDGPLDMRMDRNQQLTAADIVNNYKKEELIKIFREYGEERFAPRIAQQIVNYRKNKPIATTLELAEIIKNAYPAKFRYKGKHPARKVFQALRIEVNKELSILPDTFDQVLEVLNTDGRIAVITFHSLEDRIVKQYFLKQENPCTCPPDLPVCVCGKKPKLKRINRKPIIPAEEEITENNRSRSAKLRIAQRTENV